MSSSTFTPSQIVDMNKEKDWTANLGMLDWDTTNIMFTKRSLIEFLKSIGTTVDPNFTNIQKLPRYAKFGKLTVSAALSEAAESTISGSSTIAETVTAPDDFKPSRRVRTVPGGPHTNIFDNDTEDDALSMAPPRPQEIEPAAKATESIPETPIEEEDSGINFTSSVKPSRRVRANPGGNSSLSNLWDTSDTQEEFKPSRRVRQIPGGQDNINSIF